MRENRWSVRYTAKPPQNKALAGVGSPMKEVVCRVSKLNFAKRKAEKAAMSKAVSEQ